jgi:hypothetical protein
MPKLHNKRDVLDRFQNNPDFKAEAMKAMEEPWFQAWLDATLVNMGPYSVDAPFNNLPHLQDRQDGGKAAINFFLHRLTHLPYTETLLPEANDDYVGFVNPSSIQAGTNAIKKS